MGTETSNRHGYNYVSEWCYSNALANSEPRKYYEHVWHDNAGGRISIMPFVLIIVGVFVFVSAIRGTYTQLAKLLVGDLTGQGSFLYWFVAILVVGAIGYVEPMKKLSDAFLLLLVMVLIIGHKGFFAQFNSALQQISQNTAAANAATTVAPMSVVASQSAPTLANTSALFGTSTQLSSTGGYML